MRLRAGEDRGDEFESGESGAGSQSGFRKARVKAVLSP